MTGMEKVWGGAVDCYKEGGKELCDSEKGLRLHSSVHSQTLHNIKTDLCNSGVSKKKKIYKDRVRTLSGQRDGHSKIKQ